MPLTQSQSKKYKKALQPENIKKGLAQNDMYLHSLYTNLMREGNYDYSKTTPLIELLQVKGKEAGVRYGAVDDFVFGYDLDPLLKVLKVDTINEIVGDRQFMSREDLVRNNEAVVNKLMEEGVGKTPPPSTDKPSLRGAGAGAGKAKEPMPTSPPPSPKKPDLREFMDTKGFEQMSDEDMSKLIKDLQGLEEEYKKPPELKRSKTSLRGGMRTPPEPTIPEAKLMREESEQKLRETIESIPADVKMEDTPSEESKETEESGIPMEEGMEKGMEESGIPKRNIEMKVSKVDDGLSAQPKAIDLVPKERFVTEGKSVEQLKDDIRYFFKKFSKQLKNVEYDKNNNNLEYLQAKHKEIVAKLSVGKKEEKIGIIISGDEYIKQKLKEIILESSINALTTKDMIISIEGKEINKTDEVASYEFREGADGLPKAKNEPVYRHIPEVNKQGEKQRKLARIPTTATKYRGLEVTAKREVRNNPFSKPQKSIRFKYSY